MLIPRVRKRRWSCLSGSEERGLLSGLGTGCPCLAHMALWIWFVFSFPFLSWLLLTLSLRLGLPRVPMTWPSKHSTLESPLMPSSLGLPLSEWTGSSVSGIWPSRAIATAKSPLVSGLWSPYMLISAATVFLAGLSTCSLTSPGIFHTQQLA